MSVSIPTVWLLLPMLAAIGAAGWALNAAWVRWVERPLLAWVASRAKVRP